MRDLLKDPLWRAEDLGRPIPDSPHAVSVALPNWSSVVGYEEEDPEVLAKLQVGYPRFVYHPFVRELFDEATRQFAERGECCLVFPSEAAAVRCAEFVRKSGANCQVRNWREQSVAVLPESAKKRALLYWRHAGEIISSRHAECLLGRRNSTANEALPQMKLRLAEWTQQPVDQVFLFPSGMAAISAAYRAAMHLAPGRRTVQLEFPYVDSLCIPRDLGSGAVFLDGPRALADLEDLMRQEKLGAVFCEVPSNPLLRTVDLAAVSRLCRAQGLPLVVDDTIGTAYNLDVYPMADLVTTSLTKAISGAGDVLAGSLIVSRHSPLAAELVAFLRSEADEGLWREDAAILEENSRDFPQRMACINEHGLALAEYLADHPAVARVYYPSIETPAKYRALLRPGGGFGGLVSIDLREAESTAPRVYDRLRVNKGPSLGTNFTLVSPYTLLAHYRELAWAEEHGVSRYLLRVAVGLEDPEELRERFKEALER